MNNTKDLIIEKEYLEYINKKKDRNENNCKYDVLEKLFKNYNHSYPKTDSNMQIQTLVHDIMKTRNIYYLSNITTLICNFLSFEDSLTLIEELKLPKKMTDLDVIKFMELHRKKNFKKDTSFSPDSKCNPELYGFQNLTNNIDTIFNNKKDNINNPVIYTKEERKDIFNEFIKSKKTTSIIENSIDNSIENSIDNNELKIIETINNIENNELNKDIYTITNNELNAKNNENIYNFSEFFLRRIFWYSIIFFSKIFTDSINFLLISYSCTFEIDDTISFLPNSFKDNNVNGTDIKIWGPYKKNRNLPFNFKFILENGNLDYPDNSFDIMTCILSLHHIENLTHILSEIKRVLKPNGIFILIEHDNYTYFDSMIIEIQHTLFAFFYDNNKDYIKNPLYSRYFNNMEWEFVMNKNEFKLLDSETYINNITESKRYDQQFYAIYKNSNKK